MKTVCAYCGKEFEAEAGAYHRATKKGLNVYCSRKHSGLGRRVSRTKRDRLLIKYFYDRFIWLADERLKEKKSASFKRDYAANPEKYRKIRKKRMKAHVEYCRRPEYRKYKQGYDQQYRAKRLYGEYWESSVALYQLANLVDNRQAKKDQQIFNKSQKRKRNANKNTKRQELERCSMGLYQPS